MKSVFLHVRQGFESDAAEEIKDHLERASISVGGLQSSTDSAFVIVDVSDEDWSKARNLIKFTDLIFTRQLLWKVNMVTLPSDGDRVTPLLTTIQNELLPSSGGNAFSGLILETPDTDSAKELSRFCKSLSRPIENNMNRLKLLPKGKGAAHLPRAHLVMTNNQTVLIALSDVSNSSAWPMGIPRLKFPPNAPSRSTLKLEEAFHVFLGADGMSQQLRPGMTAVDLGACPGGWTYQLVKHGLHTTAIDNGAIDQKLMSTGLVTHLREDAFKYRPYQQVDWLVCDVVEQPSRISSLMSDWFAHGYCERAIFNLKLPMKKRYQETIACISDLKTTVESSGKKIRIAAKQLYHDRKEVTVFCTLVN